MTENQEPANDKVVVVTKGSADDKDYLRAVVHTDEDSANAYLAEAKTNTPWLNHSVVSAADFASASESATGKDDH